MKKIYLVNEFVDYEEEIIDPPYYLKSFVFMNESEARKFLRAAKKANTKNGEDYRYELEVDFLYDNSKAGMKYIKDRDKLTKE